MNEILLMWAAVSLYSVSAILFVFGTVFRRDALVSAALWVALAGLVPHSIAIAIRWVQVGHGPYLGFYEVVSSYAWMSIAALAVVSLRRPGVRVLGVVLAPVAVLLLGGAMLSPKSPLEITAKLASFWLNIHVVFAKLAYMSFIAAFAAALVYLIRMRAEQKADSMLARMPSQDTLDDVSFRFIAVGFIFLSIMIVAGAIWANEAWGRYWAFDPIETWSLISWIVYAGYLHVRLTLRWPAEKAAWYAVVALPVMLFTLIGVPLAYNSIHGAYLTGVN